MHDERLYELSNQELLKWRFEEIRPGHEYPSASEFMIRSHHVKYYVPLVSGEATPYELSQLITNGSIDNKYAGPLYEDDTVGVTPRERFVFETMVQANFERYLVLPGNATVCIGPYIDELCNACATGDHCIIRDSIKYGESLYAAGISILLTRLGYDESIELKVGVLDVPADYRYKYMLELSLSKEVFEVAMRYLHERKISLEGYLRDEINSPFVPTDNVVWFNEYIKGLLFK